MNVNQLKHELHDTYQKNEKITTNFEAVNDEVLTNKAYQDEKVSKIDGHLSLLEKHYNEFFLNYNKQSVEELLIQRVVETIIQLLYDKGLFDNFSNADCILKDFLFATRRRAKFRGSK